jgi:hypothetical protein
MKLDATSSYIRAIGGANCSLFLVFKYSGYDLLLLRFSWRLRFDWPTVEFGIMTDIERRDGVVKGPQSSLPLTGLMSAATQFNFYLIKSLILLNSDIKFHVALLAYPRTAHLVVRVQIIHSYP